mgnify:CR=1 FL=1
MNARQAIDQAKARLIDDRDFSAVLNSTGSVRIPVFMPAQTTWIAEVVPTSDGAPVVTFTIEETIFGKRLMAEFDGHKEFAA